MHLHWLLPISRTDVLLPQKVQEEGLETYPHLPEFLWDGLEEEPIFLIPSPCQFPCQLLLCNWKRELRPREDQTVTLLVPKWRESGYHPSLKLLQDNNQARAQLEYKLVQEAQDLAQSYECKWAKQVQRHARCWAQLLNQTDATFQEVFLQADSMEAIKLLSWCVTGVVSLHYIGGAVVTATQLIEDVPSMLELCPMEPEPEPCGWPAPGPSRVFISPPGTSPPLVFSSIPDIPLLCTPLVGHPFPYFSTTS